MDLIKGKKYRWKYKPLFSKGEVEETGYFTGEFDELSNMPRMKVEVDLGDGRTAEGYILVDPNVLKPISEDDERSATPPEALGDSAVTNIAIVEDGDGKIHEFMKIIDERERCMRDAFQSEVQGWADELGGVILAIYRKRDVVQRCWL